METIEYCKLIETWANYHEEDIGCDCDMFEVRKCQNSDRECCGCNCHLVYQNRKTIINTDCKSCLIHLEQANISISSVAVQQNSEVVSQ